MAVRVRTMGEMGLDHDEREGVTCWKCSTRFEESRSAMRGTCPRCGSQVAMHRLKMPTMPNGGGRGEVIRLRKEVGIGEKAHDPVVVVRSEVQLKQITMLENGEPVSILERGGTPDFASPERLPFAARRRIEERRRELFEEAEPRQPGEQEGVEIRAVTHRMLVASIAVFVTLVLLAVVFALRGG